MTAARQPCQVKYHHRTDRVKNASCEPAGESYDWYTPVTNDVKDDLTELEKANIALLTRYEKYAEKHYDDFGR